MRLWRPIDTLTQNLGWVGGYKLLCASTAHFCTEARTDRTKAFPIARRTRAALAFRVLPWPVFNPFPAQPHNHALSPHPGVTPQPIALKPITFTGELHMFLNTFRSTRISARLRHVQEHSSPANMEARTCLSHEWQRPRQGSRSITANEEARDIVPEYTMSWDLD